MISSKTSKQLKTLLPHVLLVQYTILFNSMESFFLIMTNQRQKYSAYETRAIQTNPAIPHMLKWIQLFRLMNANMITLRDRVITDWSLFHKLSPCTECWGLRNYEYVLLCSKCNYLIMPFASNICRSSLLGRL